MIYKKLKGVPIDCLDPKYSSIEHSMRDYQEQAPTLTSRDYKDPLKIAIPIADDNVPIEALWREKYKCYVVIRKVTPREYFRLQGWTDKYFDRAMLVNSDSQLYKQAGNGVTVSAINSIAQALDIL